MLMPALRKAIKQRQEAGTRIKQIKKAPKRIDSGLSNQYEHNDYDIDELQDS